MIRSFDGAYEFLSNFYPSPIEWEGLLFPTVEHAFQAAKTLDPVKRQAFTGGDPGAAKEIGGSLALRPDWDAVKRPLMAELVALKFEIPALRRRLLATGDEPLINGNWWGDRTWGVVRGEGANELGLILMEVREQVRR